MKVYKIYSLIYRQPRDLVWFSVRGKVDSEMNIFVWDEARVLVEVPVKNAFVVPFMIDEMIKK